MFPTLRNPLQQLASTIRRIWRSQQLIDPTVEDRLQVLGQQSTTLTSNISSLENFIVGSPTSVQEHRLRLMNTLPAPDEMMAAPVLRLRRQQIHAIKVRRYKDLSGFIFLLVSLAGVLLWLGYQLTFYSIL
ncbi:MAG: hypothetical protein ACI9R3_005420 [Verrucomicrobiales bacterium]|jgi:hypothetical protein